MVLQIRQRIGCKRSEMQQRLRKTHGSWEKLHQKRDMYILSKTLQKLHEKKQISIWLPFASESRPCNLTEGAFHLRDCIKSGGAAAYNANLQPLGRICMASKVSAGQDLRRMLCRQKRSCQDTLAQIELAPQGMIENQMTSAYHQRAQLLLSS